MGPVLDRRDALRIGGAALLTGCGGKPIFPIAPKQQNLGTTMVDLHCHAFNVRDLPIEGFAAHLYELPRFVRIVVLRPLVRFYLKETRSDAKDRAELEAAIKGEVPRFLRLRGSTREEQEQVLVDAVHDLEYDRPHLESGGWTEPFPALAARALAEARSESGIPQGQPSVTPTPATTPTGPASSDDPPPAVDVPAVQPNPDLERFDAAARKALAADPELRELLDGVSESGPLHERFIPIVKQVLDTLRLFRTSRAQMAIWMAASYPTIDLFTPSLVDFRGWVSDKPRTGPAEQVALMALVSRWSMKVDFADLATDVPFDAPKIHPIAPYDPSQKDAMTVLTTAVEQHAFVGVKVYPPCGFLPLGNGSDTERMSRTEAGLLALYDFCTEVDLPLLTHCSRSNGLNPDSALKAHPRHWRDVLDKYPKLRVCLGHAGHLYRDPDGSYWIDEIIKMMNDYPGRVFADISNSEVVDNPKYRARFLTMLTEDDGRRAKALAPGLVYGSDWFMNRIYRTEGLHFPPQWLALFGEASMSPEAAMGQQALRFLGLAKGMKSGNRERLQAYYKKHETRFPKWLA